MKNIIALFNDINSKFVELFNKSMNNIENVTSDEKCYLNIIYELNKTTLTRFAQIAKVTKPAATQIINKLINKGLVIKNTSDKDHRVCYIELTEEIKKLFKECYNQLNKMYSDCLSFLTEEEINEFSGLLIKINDNIKT